MTYETHFTFDAKDAETVETLAKGTDWKFSKIDGDPLLGQKVHAYLTGHQPFLSRAVEYKDALIKQLATAGIRILRIKIEHIIFDTKTGLTLAPEHQALL